MNLDWRDSALYRLSRLRTSGKLIGSNQCACLSRAPRNCVDVSSAGAAQAGPTLNFLNVAIQQSCSSYPLSLLKRASSGVVRMLSASFMTSSMVRLARCKIFVSAQLIGWSFIHACSVMADLSVRHLAFGRNNGGRFHMGSDESLVSFDVTSLFTNVPIEEAVGVIRDKLREVERTPLSPDRVAEQLSLCLNSTYFSFGGEFYEQRQGAAMGCPVSAVDRSQPILFRGAGSRALESTCGRDMWMTHAASLGKVMWMGSSIT